MQISLQEIEAARLARDPALAELCIALAESDASAAEAAGAESDHEAEEASDQALEAYFRTIDSSAFAALPELEQARYRVRQLKLIEAMPGSPERYRIYPVLLALWRSQGHYERQTLKRVIAEAALQHGVWKAIKTIYKEAQESNDSDMFGAIAARLDADQASGAGGREVRRGTYIYLVRRAWRHLRGLGRGFPAAYCQSAADVLKAYPEQTEWRKTWIANHIFFHGSRLYGSRRFKAELKTGDLLRQRAFAELWQRSPQPLLRLLEEARASEVLRFAIDSLKKEQAIALREIDPRVLLRLLRLQRAELDAFCVWIFESVPRFEQGRLRELGLHEAVLGLLRSDSDKALHFAAVYVRAHAQDLPLSQVLELVNHGHKEVRELAVALLSGRDPRRDVGLAAWTSLLGTPWGTDLAEAAIVKHFSARELDQAWFRAALLRPASFPFAAEQLPRIFKPDALGPDFFIALFDDPAFGAYAVPFVFQQLSKFKPDSLDPGFLRRALFSTLSREQLLGWVERGQLDSTRFGVEALMALAFEPEFETSGWIQDLIRADREHLQRHYPEAFDEALSARIFGWLSDVRRFEPKEIGFARLMQLVERKEPRYHDFASRYMIKAFVPADFAPNAAESEAQVADQSPAEAISVDLQGQSFLFTGKLKTMTRAQAEQKLAAAKGKEGSGVSRTLDYLVIGDEGSPLYGAGRKGSKQLKAEALIAEGAPLRIISETAFLQLLAGKRREADADSVAAGSEQLWELATRPGSERNPLRQFAIAYLRHHHQDLGPILSDRPVDPGAEIPHDFFSFERLLPLFRDKRPGLVDFALELAHWEAARWHPPFGELVTLAESAPLPVREFFAKALTAGPEKRHDPYRLPTDLISADRVYRLCESPDDFARQLGMRLLELHPRLADPASLFRLTESADRRMRYFAVEAIWRSYRDRGVSPDWQPRPLSAPQAPGASPGQELTDSPAPLTAAKDSRGRQSGKESKASATAAKGSKLKGGAETALPAEPATRPRQSSQPSPWLAGPDSMQSFLRRMLFELPPGRQSGKRGQVRTLPASKAKLALVETYRSMALRDRAFAALVVPVLSEFMASRGQLEARACLVALTRIAQRFPEFSSSEAAV